MFRALARTLKFLRVTDCDGDLSITHACCYVAMYTLARAQNVSAADVGTLLVAMLAYGHKKQLEAGAAGGHTDEGSNG